MKRHSPGLTMVEILTVVAIIAILIGLLIPAANAARAAARRAKQKVQLAAISTGLVVFRSDFGDYPPSSAEGTTGVTYCGAQKLAEALLGRDLRGFDPNSKWFPGDKAYLPLSNRKDLYLDPDTANPFRLGLLYGDPTPYSLAPDTFVLCDVYTHPKRTALLPDKSVRRAGSPILYFRADSSMKLIQDIYRIGDNLDLIEMKEARDVNKGILHVVGPWATGVKTSVDLGYEFCRFIRDPRIGTETGSRADMDTWQPYRRDSFILISAGPDEIYGTSDDICNFSSSEL